MISPKEYQQRRQTLANQLPTGAVAVIAASEELLRNGDAAYRFRQNSHYFYLTGCHEPDSLLIITAEASILFNRQRNPEEEQWTGARLGQEGACRELGMDKAWPLQDIPHQLPELLADSTAVYYLLNQDLRARQYVFDALEILSKKQRKGIKPPDTLCDLEPLLSEMRLFKSTAEKDLMRKAAAISVEAHIRAMQTCKNLSHEYVLEAELMYTFLRHGCRSAAYDSIVAGGGNACVLHYTANDKPLKSGDLVLIDAGGEFGNYASDITRTFPVNGKYSAEQAAIYELVYSAWKAGIDCVKPNVPWNMIQQTIIRVLTTGLCDLGILTGSIDDCMATEAYKPFYMHNSGHWLGLDVHDAGSYKQQGAWRDLQPDMVLTVEPGLYITENPAVDKKWWNIGVRIEDDILVTTAGHENLTAALPAKLADIEALVRG